MIWGYPHGLGTPICQSGSDSLPSRDEVFVPLILGQTGKIWKNHSGHSGISMSCKQKVGLNTSKTALVVATRSTSGCNQNLCFNRTNGSLGKTNVSDKQDLPNMRNQMRMNCQLSNIVIFVGQCQICSLTKTVGLFNL